MSKPNRRPASRLMRRQAAYGIGQYASMFILFMAMFVTAFSATLLGLGKSRGNATDVFSPMGEGETKSA